MATFLSFPALALQQESPQAFPGHTVSQEEENHTTQLITADEEISRLTEQYEVEAARLADRADLCGIQQEMLSSKGRLNLQLLVSIASTLQLAQATPELILAAWAALLVKESQASTLWSKLRLGEADVARKLHLLQAKKKTLQQVLHDVQSQQKRWAALVQDHKRMAAQFRQKSQQYCSDAARSQKHLDRENFSEEITHAKLVRRQQEVARLQQVLADNRAELDGYHHLPTSVLGARMMLEKAEKRLNEKKQELQLRMA